MPSVPIVDAKGKSQQALELSDDVFGAIRGCRSCTRRW